MATLFYIIAYTHLVYLVVLHIFVSLLRLYSSYTCYKISIAPKLSPHNFFFPSGCSANTLFAVMLLTTLMISWGLLLGTDCIKKMYMIFICSYFQKRNPHVSQLYPHTCLPNAFIRTFIYHYATIFCWTHNVVHKI